jgi:uncharacterized Zn-finger protein
MSTPKPVIELSAAELVGHGNTCCPGPQAPLWNQHPKVFIHLGDKGEGRCPYCGTVYRLRAGQALAAGH